MADLIGVIVPIVIDSAKLISSTVGEPAAGETTWLAGTTYAAGDYVILPSTHRTYKSLQAGNLGRDPSNPVNSDWWFDESSTIRWGMFDGRSSFATTVSSPLTVVLQPGRFNSIAFAGLVAANISVSVKDAPGGTVIFTYSGSLKSSKSYSWRTYWFSGLKAISDLVLTGIPMYKNAEVTITISGSGTVKCGVVSFGDYRSFGLAEYGSSASPRSYTSVRQNTDGTQTFVRRTAGNDLALTCTIDHSDSNAVHQIAMDTLDVPAMWIGKTESSFAFLRTFGIGTVKITTYLPTADRVSINVIGLI